MKKSYKISILIGLSLIFSLFVSVFPVIKAEAQSSDAAKYYYLELGSSDQGIDPDPDHLDCSVYFADGSVWNVFDVWSGPPNYFGPHESKSYVSTYFCNDYSPQRTQNVEAGYSKPHSENVVSCPSSSGKPPSCEQSNNPTNPIVTSGDSGNPVGHLENVSCSVISGWSYDPDAKSTTSTPISNPSSNQNSGTNNTPYGPVDEDEFDRANYYNNFINFKGIVESIVTAFKPLIVWAKSSDSNSVQIFDGPKESGTLLVVVGASQPRPDVNQTMSVSGNHGFSWSPSESLKDGNIHNIYVYGTNIESPGETTLLSGAPKSLKCEPGVTNTPPSAPTLSCPADGSSTGSSLSISFSSTDADGNNVRYLVDWDANDTTDVLVPSNGTYVAQNTVQSSSKIWSSPGFKTVKVRTQDDQGEMSSPSSCSFTLNGPDTTPTTPGGPDGNGNGGNGGGGTGNNPGDPNNPDNSGFTVNGTAKLAIQFLGDLTATSQTGNMSVNPVGGFAEPVIVSVESLKSVGGADYTAGTPVYYLGGEERSSVTMTYDASRGFYVNQNGLIGLTFSVKLPVKITEKHYVTIVARSGAKSASYVIELNPSSKAPQFQEI